MSRERRHAEALARGARQDFNEARLHEPGEATGIVGSESAGEVLQ